LISEDEIAKFMKRRRKRQMVIFEGELLNNLICVYCKQPIKKEHGNRVDLIPIVENGVKKIRILAYHYECAWKRLFEEIYKVGSIMQI